MQLRIEKVLTLPATLEASTMYILRSEDADLAEMYITDSTGATVSRLLKKSDVEAMIAPLEARLTFLESYV